MTSVYLIVCAASLGGLSIVTLGALTGWRGWLDLKARELDRFPREIEHSTATGMARIELSDLKERIRKLEAIAAGVDL
ncbi:MAG: hypothetical protein JWQ16_3269 [Novosphingobium sp.]|nr:hypothetical protein [Novosphingobium sp.]